MLTIAVQRRGFLVAAGIGLLAALLPRPPASVEIVVAAILIVALGVPHGALDTLYARRARGVDTTGRALGFLLAYLAAGACVVGLWMLSPLLFLAVFLAGSAFHFAGDPEEGASVLVRLAYGVGVVTLPALRHGDELRRLYALLTDAGTAETTAAASIPLAGVALAAGVLGSLLLVRERRWAQACEVVAVLALATFAPPLVAFAVYFCGMHSARHILRSAALMPQAPGRLALECVAPMVAVVLGGAVAWRFVGSGLDARVVRVLFIGLAALTAPHMILVEPIRLRGWRLPNRAPGLSGR